MALNKSGKIVSPRIFTYMHVAIYSITKPACAVVRRNRRGEVGHDVLKDHGTSCSVQPTRALSVPTANRAKPDGPLY